MADKVNEAGSKSRPGGYSFAKQQARRDQRREAAEARQAKHDALTVEQKLAKAQKRGGSQKEIKRLLDLIAAGKAAPKKVEPPKTEPTEKKAKSKYQRKRVTKSTE